MVNNKTVKLQLILYSLKNTLADLKMVCASKVGIKLLASKSCKYTKNLWAQ